MNIVRDPSSDFIRQITPKYELMFHGTGGGTYTGADATLDIPDKINVPYALDTDGTLIERFDPRYYSYHAGNNNHNKNTLAIEIVGWVYVDFHDGFFWTWTGKKVAPEQVVKLKQFRGHEYFFKLTPKQELALPEFIQMAIEMFPTIKTLLTHAEVNTNRSDFPPDFEQIYSQIDLFNNNLLIDKDSIKEGTEKNYSDADIQKRINFLVKKYGYHNNELSRLIKYRNEKRGN